jgi:transcriptional regulator with XRE-family HTH domain
MTADEWESAFTQVIVRNLAAAREDAGLTIEQFAGRCDAVVGEKGRFKPNTLQGLFAGKRKNLSYAELAVFAAALDLRLESLLIPVLTGELVPLPDGRQLTPIEMWAYISEVAAKPTYGTPAGEKIPKARVRSRLIRRAAQQHKELSQSLSFLSSDISHPEYAERSLARARLGVQVCRADLDELDRGHIPVDESDPLTRFLRTVDLEFLTDDELLAIGRRLRDGAPTDSDR